MKYFRFLSAALLVFGLLFGANVLLGNRNVPAVFAAEDGGGSGEPADNGDVEAGVNDCIGGQCGAETSEIDNCSVSGSQCYNPHYCSEYNTPRYSSSLSVSAQVGQPFSYEIKVAQVNPNPSRSLAPWEHPQLREREPFEEGWFGANVTSIDAAGLAASGLSANFNSVTVQKRAGVPQIPDSTGLIISGTPTVAGTYLVPLNSQNNLEEWIYEGGAGDNQSSTVAGSGRNGYFINRSPSCSHADVLEIQVAQCSAGAAPTITTPDRVTGQVGTAFSFQATANNHTTLGMSADALPEGTHWDGPLSVAGIPTVAGDFTFSIDAESQCGGSVHKSVAVHIDPAGECVGNTPTITSAGSVAAIIGSAFPGYTIQTAHPASSYSLTPSSGDDSFPASLGITNGGRSLEGTVASTQPKQQYHFRAQATNVLPSGTSCPMTKEVAIGLNCPSDRPNWDSSSGQCTDHCTDQAALNYGQAGQCRYDTTPTRCNDPLALNGGALGACRYSPGRSLCTDPSAINFGLTGSCQPRTSCGAGESGRFPSCQEIPCPTCGQTKMCNVCTATDRDGECTRHEMRPADEVQSAPNSCGLTRSLYYCPDENSPAPPPPPGEQACALAVTAIMPERELIQKGSQCTIPWRVSGVPSGQSQFLRCVISGPDFSVRATGSAGQVVTPAVSVQSLYRLVCRNGDAKVSNTASFTCRVSPRFEER